MKDMPKNLEQPLKKAFNEDCVATTIVLARRVLADNPTDSLTLNRLGNVLSSVSRFTEAEIVLRDALEHSPENRKHVALANLGLLFELQGQYDTAANWFRKTIDRKPDDATGYIFLGATLARAGKLFEAEEIYRQGTQCARGCIDEAWCNLGLVLRGLERFKESRKCFELAIEIDPEYDDAMDALADVKSAMGWQQSDG